MVSTFYLNIVNLRHQESKKVRAKSSHYFTNSCYVNMGRFVYNHISINIPDSITKFCVFQ